MLKRPLHFPAPSLKSFSISPVKTRMKKIAQIFASLLILSATAAFAEDAKYKIVPDFFDEKTDCKQLCPCHGAAVIDKDENIYVTTDTPRGIIVFSPEGKFVRNFGPTRIHGAELRNENGTEYIYGARPHDP